MPTVIHNINNNEYCFLLNTHLMSIHDNQICFRELGTAKVTYLDFKTGADCKLAFNFLMHLLKTNPPVIIYCKKLTEDTDNYIRTINEKKND